MQKYTKSCALVLVIVMMLSLFSGCGTAAIDSKLSDDDLSAAFVDEVVLDDVDISEEDVALQETPAISSDLTPVASGKLVKTTSKAVIDYSNTSDGYVMVKFTASSSKKIKAQVKGPSGTTYTYNLSAAAINWTTFPLSDGNGSYKITVFENTSGTKYASVASVTCSVTLKDEFAPFIRTNQYVDYSNAPNTIAKAAELTKGITDPLEKVKVVYNYVVTNITYDKEKASSVKSGYLPVLDTILASKKGICFDYAALMTAMLRSQGVPCKLVVGYAGQAYHAWISVYSENTGWINAAIYFNGKSWQRMDPTFASSANQSDSIMKYIGDGSHYTAKYLY